MSRSLSWGAIASALALAVMPAMAWAQSAAPYLSATLYDAGRRVVGTIAPDPDGAGTLHYLAVRNTYDTAGRLTRTEKGELATWQTGTAPSGWTGFTVYLITDTAYDAFDRKITETVKGSDLVIKQATQYSYDTVGRPLCIAVRMNPATFNALPSDVCSPGTAGSDGPDRITKNIYDAAGQLIQVRKAVGVSGTEQAYATYTYTIDGKQEYVIDAGGNRAKFEYDGFDRQIKWFFSSSTKPTAYNPYNQANALSTAGTFNSADLEQYGYDANGNRTSLTKRDGQVIKYTYDALNRMVTKDPPGTTADVSYSYDLQGHQLAATFVAGGQGVTNGYDGFGRLTSSVTTMGGNSRTLGYQYDADGNRKRVTLPDGNYTSYDYDGLDRMIALWENGTAKAVDIAYDSAGRPFGLQRGGSASLDNSGYGYDGISRLTSLSHDLSGSAADLTLGFSYNAASQMIGRTTSNDGYAFTATYNLSRSYTANGLNQYSQIASSATINPTYDANGNLTSAGGTTYWYDSENRLVSASGASNVVLAYDPMGRLFQTSGGSGGTTQFLYDGDELVAEYDGVNALLRRYVHGPAVDEPLVWYEGSGLGQRRYLHANHQGSIVAVSDSSGTALQANAYDPYGIPMPNNLGRFAFTGQIWIPELGMYHYKARVYSPTLGRFLQTDPVGYKDQMDLYAYVGNDPIDGTDPTGMEDPKSQSADTCSKSPGCTILYSGTGTKLIESKIDISKPLGNFSPTKTDKDESTLPIPEIVVVGARLLGVTVGAPIHLAIMVGNAFNDPLCCFTAGTLVSTPAGLRAIETLKAGDLVMSRSDQTGETAAKPIMSITPAHERRIWTVTVSYKGKDGRRQDERYETTDDHPWRTADGHWVASASLKHGQTLARESGTAIVISVVDTGKSKLTYNLEIADFHTYFVGEAETWVHNACPQGPRLFRGKLRDEVNGGPNPKCVYCGKPATQVDHVIPYSRGGPTSAKNGVPACASCNLSKGAKDLIEWLLGR